MILTLRRVARLLLVCEPLALLAALYYFWWPSNYPFGFAEPIDRAEYSGLLLFVPAFMLLRWIAFGRAWTRTPLDVWAVGFIVIGLLNSRIAPYVTRGDFMLTRPLLGLWCVVYLMEAARQFRGMTVSLGWMLLLCLGTGGVALVTTGWVDKAPLITAITRALPRTDALRPFITTFNPNEIAGALAWLTPAAAALVLYPFAPFASVRPRLGRVLGTGMRLWSAVAFALLFAALFLGQSRFAIVGVITGLGILALLIVPRGWQRWGALAVPGLILALQAALLLNLLPAPANAQAGETGGTSGISARDESSFTRRFDIWRSGIDIMLDHPISGAGINLFRLGAVRADYPVETYDYNCPTNCPRVLPHAHNELIQTGADLGIPGMLVYLGWHGATVYMLWEGWRQGGRGGQVVAAAVGAGLFAHLFYGLGDAVTLWDRFAFVQWVLIGLAAAQYALVREARAAVPASERSALVGAAGALEGQPS